MYRHDAASVVLALALRTVFMYSMYVLVTLCTTLRRSVIETRSQLSAAVHSAMMEELRPMSSEEIAQGQEALKRLFEHASGFSGQAKGVARFLLSLWDSDSSRFEPSAWRGFDRPIVRDCLSVLYWYSEVGYRIWNHAAGGEETMKRIARHWNGEATA